MWAFALLSGCTEYGYSDRLWTDVFQQDRANEVDLLVVIDNSCSMVEEQGNLARNFDALLQRFVDAEVDWRVAVTTTDTEEDRFRGRLQGGDDELIVRGATGVIDSVAYDRTWGFQDGIARGLSAELTASNSNDQREAWCASSTIYAPGLRGTPGLLNPRCDGLAVQAPLPAPDLGPRAPSGGDLVVTELLPQSGIDDRSCEWVELTNTTDDTLELEGVRLEDAGNNLVIFPSFQLAPRAAMVVGRSADCGVAVDLMFAEGFSLNDDLRFIGSDEPAAAELFSEAVAQGTVGTGIELGFEAARLVFEEPYYSEQNQSWLRDEAKLAVLFVSDEDDLSPLPVDGYLDRFAELKGLRGYRDPQTVTVSAVVGTDRPPHEDAPACISDNGLGFYGERYLAAANRTGGLAESICTEDFAPIVSQLGLTLSGLTLTFELSRQPKLDTLIVSVYADESSDSLIGDLERDVDFSYDPVANALVFTVDQAPPAATFIVAKYELLPNGATNLPDDGQDPEPPEPPAVP